MGRGFPPASLVATCCLRVRDSLTPSATQPHALTLTQTPTQDKRQQPASPEPPTKQGRQVTGNRPLGPWIYYYLVFTPEAPKLDAISTLERWC